MKMIKVEIITPVHNRRDETLQCLKSLGRCDTSGISIHIIVVDDGSTDGTAKAIAENYPDVEVVKGDGSLWYTAGANRGMEAALRHDPDYILSINNDSIFDEKCIVSMVRCAEKYPHSVIGALLLDWSAPPAIFQVAPKWDLGRGGFRHWRRQTAFTVPQQPWEVDLIVGNCVLFPAAAVREVGFMDERLVQYGDSEYTPRMKRRGWRLIIEPRARVYCKPNDVITGFRNKPLLRKLKALLFEPAGPYSVQRKYYSSVGGAPSRVQGLLSIPIYYFRLLIGKNQEGQWGLNQPEEPLSETYRHSVLTDR